MTHEQKESFKMKKKETYLLRIDRSGFTMVELIVVLLILSVLAALLIPALSGYLEEAKEAQMLAETRQIVIAAQTLYNEGQASGGGDAAAIQNCTKEKIAELAEVDVDAIDEVAFAADRVVFVRCQSIGNGSDACYYYRDKTKPDGCFTFKHDRPPVSDRGDIQLDPGVTMLQAVAHHLE